MLANLSRFLVVLICTVAMAPSWADHWSLRSVDRDLVPQSDSIAESARVIDDLVDQQILRAGFLANPPADPRTQVRRVCLDLTGLPPTRNQMAEFLADDSDQAYENLVDRLLQSKHFGQHFGRQWLDLVRYADTHGMHLDNYREMWPYRDWVIDALNANMPFDQFATKQIAGDLLPDANDADRVASGFNRLNLTTNEAGSIYEEVVARNCIDRTNAFGTVFLGLTMECAACHDHKYDPITQQDYYSLLAFFNSLDGPALDQNLKDPPPVIELPSADQKKQLVEFDLAIANFRKEMQGPIPSVDRAQFAWERSLTGEFASNQHRIDSVAGQNSVDAPLPPDIQWQSIHVSGHGIVDAAITVEATDDDLDGSWINVPIEWTFHDSVKGGRWFGTPSLIAEGPNARVRISWENSVDDVQLTLHDSLPRFPSSQQVKLGPMHALGPLEIESPSRGYDRTFASQQEAFRRDEVFRYLDRPYRWQHRADWKQANAIEIPVIKDRPSVTMVHQGIESPDDHSVDLLLGVDDGYVVYLNGDEIAKADKAMRRPALSQRHVLRLKQGHNDLYLKLVNHHGPSTLTYAFASPRIEVPESIAEWVRLPPRKRSQADTKFIQFYFRHVQCQHPDWQTIVDLVSGTRRSRQKLKDQIPTSLVWKETSSPRPARVLDRGLYDSPGEIVSRATPQCLPPLPDGVPIDRRGLANWLTSPDHPLAARVAVNRFWQSIFGTGLVKSSDDFGIQGEPPSHPALLDFLAADFQRHHWDIKRLIKSIVISDTYRRDATRSAEMQSIDPGNRWLTRGPRFRLDPEVLRDQALLLSGQLVDDLGGPSVKPPQPDGLWESVGYIGSNTAKFKADVGDKVYRRSVYVFWKRTSPPPQFATFDGPSRESCTAMRERTNTPMQALTLMNQQPYLEAARELARTRSGSNDNIDQLNQLFEDVTMRQASDAELVELGHLFTSLLTHYQSNPGQAQELVGSSDADWAAWTMVASTLLNLDEVVNK
jgi:hypothetical protein